MGGQPGNTYVFSTGIEQYKNRLDLGADYASINDVDDVDNFYDQGYLFGLNNMQVDTERCRRWSSRSIVLPAYLAAQEYRSFVGDAPAYYRYTKRCYS